MDYGDEEGEIVVEKEEIVEKLGEDAVENGSDEQPEEGEDAQCCDGDLDYGGEEEEIVEKGG